MSIVNLTTTQDGKSQIPDRVVVHPLVLLSVVDHYTRSGVAGRKRVLGVLLGDTYRGRVDVTNSYAVPFEESPEEDIWYLDHNYHEQMFGMFKKVSAKEKIVGWYHTGPKIRKNDLEINELFRRYIPNPVLCIIDVDPKQSHQELPTNAYIAVEEVPEKSSIAFGRSSEGSDPNAPASSASSSKQQQQKKGTPTTSFLHIPSEVGAHEAEEVGVEHLLRGVVDYTVSSSADQIVQQVGSLQGLRRRLLDISQYLDRVCNGDLPPNTEILYNLQELFNLLPNLKVKEMVDAIRVTVNDNHIVMYVAGVIRSILALHDLINNRLNNQRHLQNKRLEKEKLLAAREKKRAAAAAAVQQEKTGADREESKESGEEEKKK